MLRLWRLALYKEPFDGPLPWINLGVGCFSIFSGLFITFSGGSTFLFVGPMLLFLGLMFVFWGVSDLLPPKRRSAILALRVGLLVFQNAAIVLAVVALLQLGLGF